MQNTFSVADIVKRANRRLLLINLLVIAVLIAIAVAFSNYLYNFFSGPFTLKSSDVAAMQDIGDQRYVTISGDDSFDLGYELVETDDRGNEKIKANYVALLLDDRLLIVQVPYVLGTTVPLEFTGELIPITAEFERQVISEVERTAPNVRGLFLPFMMKEHNYRLNGFIGLAIGGFVLLVCLFFLFLFMKRSRDVNQHPIMQNLAKFGGLDRIVPHLESELNFTQHETLKDVHLTKTWMVKTNGKTSLEAMPHHDIMWVFKKVTQHRTNGINTRKTYAAEFHNRHGKSITIGGKENAVDDAIKAVYPYAPWAIYGYSDDIKKAWNKERNNVIAAVDDRREKIKNAGASSQSAT